MGSAIETVRRPAGAPDGRGGEFATRHLTDPEGNLAEETRGSFLYPPDRFPSYEEYIEFWESSPISDRVLSNASHAYRTWLQGAEDAYVRANWHRFEEGNAKTDRMLHKKLGADAQTVNVESRQSLIDEFREKYPSEVSPRHMRQVLRAYSVASYWASIEDPSGRGLAQRYTTEIDGQALTLDEIAQRYCPDNWAERALTEADLPVVDSLRYMAQATDQRDGYETGEAVVSPY